MFSFNSKPVGTYDLVARLLDAASDDRQFVLMTALQRGELRLSNAANVLGIVARIETCGIPGPRPEVRRR